MNIRPFIISGDTERHPASESPDGRVHRWLHVLHWVRDEPDGPLGPHLLRPRTLLRVLRKPAGQRLRGRLLQQGHRRKLATGRCLPHFLIQVSTFFVLSSRYTVTNSVLFYTIHNQGSV